MLQCKLCRPYRSFCAQSILATPAKRQANTRAVLNNLQGQVTTSEEDAGKPLQEYLGPGLQLMEQSFQIDSCDIKLITPRSSDAVMDYCIDSEQWDRDPYWCRAWPSALALAQLLLRRPDLVRRKRVCEIGAGLGIAGMSAAIAGASQVVLTDREPLALECALRSSRASGINTDQEIMMRPSAGSGKDAQLFATLLDWTNPGTNIGSYDTLLACDVLYEKQAVSPVANLIPNLLDSRDGLFILADPESRTRPHREEMIRLLTGNEKHRMSLESSEAVTINMDGISHQIQLAIFRTKQYKETIGLKHLSAA